jgi:hypothetical protein
MTIRCEATLSAIDEWTIARIPKAASAELPSRGQVAVKATINGHPFTTVVEPDGLRGHWIKLEDRLRKAAAVSAGDSAVLEMEPTKEWPEPDVPGDLLAALSAAPPGIRQLWADITPMARWEWVRWVNATRNPDTRRRRVEVTISKMSSGKRRPCCFDLSSCTDPHLSSSGKLLEPR